MMSKKKKLVYKATAKLSSMCVLSESTLRYD